MKPHLFKINRLYLNIHLKLCW